MIMNIFEKAGITPGPWRAMKPKGSNGFWYVGPEGDKTGSTATCYEDDPVSKSNARLIAAAPEMLEDEVDNKNDAHSAMIELEKDIPDLQKVFNLLGNIVARSANGAEKATGLSWEQINAE